ncbi:hypothetical protein FSP39_010462 [Pinctada imbricata]|uniref:PABC domain-containing protein n=1 Tax=Pinctada imbricata TaxID=66713 RepID=A0AA88XNV5_PINIB|nr:hypothetical protein FSP39_010462 [Pinctada imbricata]
MVSLPKYSTSGMKPELLDFEDAAGEHLFIKITQSHPKLSQSMIEQITGMMLNCGSNTEILHMLQDDDFLQRRVEAASKILSESSKSCDSPDKPEADNAPGNDLYEADNAPDDDLYEAVNALDDDLYEAVEKLQPDFAPQITGMLLELSPSMKRRIVACPMELQEAVDRAMTMLVPQGEGGISDLGEMVYEVVETMYPQLAEKITGMLLELSKEELTELIRSRSRLQQKAQLAYKTLQEASSTV